MEHGTRRHGALSKGNRLAESETGTGARARPYAGKRYPLVKRKRVASSLRPIYDEVKIVKETKKQQEFNYRGGEAVFEARKFAIGWKRFSEYI